MFHVFICLDRLKSRVLIFVLAQRFKLLILKPKGA